MSDIIIYDTLSNRAKQYFASVDASFYQGRNDVMIFENETEQTIQQLRNLLESVPLIYIKKTGNPAVSEMSQSEKFSVDAEREFVDTEEDIGIEINYYNESLLIQALAEYIFPGSNPSDIQKKIVDKIKEIAKRR